MLPQRPGNSGPVPPTAARKSGPVPFPTLSFDALKTRVLGKLEDRLDPSASKRMPVSLLRQSLRQLAEQVADQEARGLAKPDRDRLVDEVLAELLGYGPLDELFKDPTVREVMVTGPQGVLVRRDANRWLPTSIKFRDEDHFRSALDRLATHADPVGGATTSMNLFDLQMPNGFRVVAVIPPPALELPAIAAFIRVESVASLIATPAPEPAVVTTPAPLASISPLAQPVPGSVTASPRPGSSLITPPVARPGGSADSPPDPLARHRKKIIEKLITKLASIGVYDLQRVEISELRRVVAAYVSEYTRVENIYLSDTDQGRLTLEILTAMNR